MDVNNKIPTTTIFIVSCLAIYLSLAPSLSFADHHDDDITFVEDPVVITASATNIASDIEGDYDMGYLEGCVGGAVVGSIVPGIGTAIGLLFGCCTAWLL